MNARTQHTSRHARTVALGAMVLAVLAPGSAFAQTTPNGPPRAPGVIGPTPTNPGDTGLGTTQGITVPGALTPTGQPATPTTNVTPMATPTPGAMSPVNIPTMAGTSPMPGIPGANSGLLQPLGALNPNAQRALAETHETVELPESIRAHGGGLTADMAAQRAATDGYTVQAAQAGVEAAQAGQSAAAWNMVPTVTGSARYSRLSDYPPFTIGSPDFQRVIRAAISNDNSCGTDFSGCVTQNVLQGAIVNQYAFRASLTIPISDIPLRLAQVYNAAGLTLEARRLDLEYARAQAGQNAREAFYNYVRALGNLAVTEQSLAAARERRADVLRFVEAGAQPRAQLLVVDATVADLERLLIVVRNGAALSESVLRQRIHASPNESLVVGESIDAPAEVPGDITNLVAHAFAHRPDLQSLDRQARALGANITATYIGAFPSLVATANADYANPNARIFPQTAEFRGTWDINLQVSWTPTAIGAVVSQANQLEAQRRQLLANLGVLREGAELEVRTYWSDARTAQALLESNRAAYASAEEGYRVLRERVRAGAAVGSELRQSEANLLSARINMISAQVDLRVAMARLKRATGEQETARANH